jgi:WD40 repeat protein
VIVAPVQGGPVRELAYSGALSPSGDNFYLAFSPDGRLLAAVPWNLGGIIQVWDLETGESRELGPVGYSESLLRAPQDLGPIGYASSSLRFVDDGHVLWTGHSDEGDQLVIQELLFDVATGAVEVLSSKPIPDDIGWELVRSVSPRGSFMLTGHVNFQSEFFDTEVRMTDLESGQPVSLAAHGPDPSAFAFDPSERFIASGGLTDGLVRVGSISGDEPHLLYGHEGWVQAIEVSPDGRWIASAGDDGTVRLWAVPDLSKPPLHTLEHNELIATLHALTNLRAVRDEVSPKGWKIEVDSFPGWAEVPEW